MDFNIEDAVGVVGSLVASVDIEKHRCYGKGSQKEGKIVKLNFVGPFVFDIGLRASLC